MIQQPILIDQLTGQPVFQPPQNQVVVLSPQRQTNIVTYPKNTDEFNKALDGVPRRNMRQAGSPYENQNLVGSDKCDLKKILEWLLYLLPLILGIMCIIGAAFLIHRNIQSDKGLRGAENVISNVHDNLNTLPLKKIFQVNAEDPCPTNTEELVIGKWDGTESGCLCEDGSQHSRAYCPFHSDCKFVPEEKEVAETKWEEKPGVPVKFCAEREKTFVKFDEKGECATGLKKCTDGCVGSGEGCPLNHIVQTDVVDATTVDKKSGNVLVFGNKKFEFKSDSADATRRSLINLQVTSGESPCFDNTVEPPIAPSFKNYPYNVRSFENCGDFKQQVNNFQPLSTLSEEKLFSLNKIEEKVEALPYQRKYFFPEDKFHLGAVKRTNVANNKACKVLGTEEGKEVHGYAIDTQNIMHGFAIAILVLACLIVFFAIVFFLFKKQISKNPVKFMWILAVIIFILAAILGMIYLCKRDKMSSAVQPYNDYLEKECYTDEPVNKALGRVVDYSNTSKDRFFDWTLYFYIASLACLVLGLIIALVYKYQVLDKQQFVDSNKDFVCRKPWD